MLDDHSWLEHSIGHVESVDPKWEAEKRKMKKLDAILRQKN
jgi:hypothetical protein